MASKKKKGSAAQTINAGKVVIADRIGSISMDRGSEARPIPKPFSTIPSLPRNHTPRPAIVEQIRSLVLGSGQGGHVAVTAVNGMGGVGKTVLVTELCVDKTLQEHFSDGIAWITMGRESGSNALERMKQIGHALGAEIGSEAEYRALIREKNALIVIDDVWSLPDIDQLLVNDASRSRVVFTTRIEAIANAVGAQVFKSNLLTPDEARELLGKLAGTPLPQPEADRVIEECGRLALALAVIGPTLRGEDLDAWRDTLTRLKNADISGIEQGLVEGQQSFFRSLEVSVQALKPLMRERYLKLAVLLEDTPAALEVLQTLWCVSDVEARQTARHLAERSLADWDASGLRIHDLLIDYLRSRVEDRDSLNLITMRFVCHCMSFGNLLGNLHRKWLEGFTRFGSENPPGNFWRNVKKERQGRGSVPRVDSILQELLCCARWRGIRIASLPWRCRATGSGRCPRLRTRR